MGARGPVPKRSSQRRRTNAPDGPPPVSGAGSSRDQWVAYARTLGIAVPDGASRSQVQQLVAEGSSEEGWHPLAQQWFAALRESGQAHWYQPSDWATARIVAEAMSRELNPQPMTVGRGDDAEVVMVKLPPKGASLTAWLSAMSSLLATEGDRRRMRIELEVDDGGEDAEAAAVTELDEARERLRQPG